MKLSEAFGVFFIVGGFSISGYFPCLFEKIVGILLAVMGLYLLLDRE